MTSLLDLIRARRAELEATEPKPVYINDQRRRALEGIHQGRPYAILVIVPRAAATVAIGVILADLVAPGIGRQRSATRCILPFRLGK
jgi:hypothetical protein